MPQTSSTQPRTWFDISRAPLADVERRLGRLAVLTLRSGTAEMLGLPSMVCGTRSCRRQHACLFYFVQAEIPRCTPNLLDDERQAYDAIYDFTVRVYAMARGSTYSPHFYLMTQEPPDYWPAVVEIVRQALPSGDIGHACLDEAVRLAGSDIKRLRQRTNP